MLNICCETNDDNNNDCLPQEQCVTIPEEVKFLEELYNKVLQGKCSVDDVLSDSCLTDLLSRFTSLKERLMRSRTPKLWLLYCDMILILRKFITTERLESTEIYICLLWLRCCHALQLQVTICTLNLW